MRTHKKQKTPILHNTAILHNIPNLSILDNLNCTKGKKRENKTKKKK